MDDEARSDVRVRGFFVEQQNAFFDFRVFYPFASSHNTKSPAQLFKKIASDKKREYEQRMIEVDNASFIPMIMSSSGMMGPEMTIVLKHLARKLATQSGEQYSHVVGVLRCRFAFSMMRMALICLRGSRRRRSGREEESEIDLSVPAVIVMHAARVH